MQYSISITFEPSKDWNKILQKFESGNIYNTVEYGEYAKKWLNWTPNFFRVIDAKGNVTLQTIIFDYFPNLSKYPSLTHGLIKKFKSSIRWQYGPATNSVDSLILFLIILKIKKNLFMAFYTHY